MISSDAALGLGVFFFFLAMMLKGVFQTFWPPEPRINLPGGGHRIRRKPAVREPAPEPVRIDARAQ